MAMEQHNAPSGGFFLPLEAKSPENASSGPIIPLLGALSHSTRVLNESGLDCHTTPAGKQQGNDMNDDSSYYLFLFAGDDQFGEQSIFTNKASEKLNKVKKTKSNRLYNDDNLQHP